MDEDETIENRFSEIKINVPDNDFSLFRATEAESISSTQQVSISSILRELEAYSQTEAKMALVPQRRRIGHCIILYLSGMREPIEIWNQNQIILGRFDSKLNYRPTVDLSEHHAAQLGVSRIHAEISYEKAAYWVQDLESKNGTWVNKTKLLPMQKMPISHRDSLRIGHFMIQVGSCQYS
jgi:hypothetical protein